MVVVPDRQLSLAIGKEGQNARLAARLSGWRLDIKGLTEWEEIKATRELEKKEQHKVAVAVLAEAEAEAPEELEVAEIAVADTITQAEAPPKREPEAAPEVIFAAAPAPAIEKLDEEAMLAALIRDEEEEKAAAADAEGPGISVEELASFTLDDVIEEDAEEQDTEEKQDQEFFSAMPVLTPDAGKIRFAEDIAVEMRGGGRRAGRAARRGGNRGGGGRR